MAENGMLQDKVVIVTGAGRGIGRAIAVAMAAEGARVVVNDIGVSLSGEGSDQTPADQVVAEIKKAGGQAIANFDSVSEWAGAHRIVDMALNSYGRLDCVVNNAGIVRDVIFHKMTEQDWDAVVNVMLKGSFNVSRAAAPHFREQQSGSLIHMTSTAGLVGNVGQANYASAQLGIVALSKSIALDMMRFNVRSNCIAPAGLTRMNSSVPTETPEQKLRAERRKLVTPEQNAPLCIFLASDVSKDVTGQVFAVRRNEIFLMSQSRPIRSVHRSEGWTGQKVADHMFPALKPSFFPLDRVVDAFPWDPV
jgi:NAD(P)-dependent dehydrogenase (short-subunit alcohol dehydrogenase family)